MGKRICVIGRPGSGKSTFAVKLAKKTGLPLVHLDQIWWKENWVESTREEFDRKLAEKLAMDSWIIEGDYSRTLKMRCAKADILYVYDLPKVQSVFGYLKRAVKNWGTSRADMPENCIEKIEWEFIKYIWNYKLTDIKSLQKEFPELKIVVMKSHKAANKILQSF